MKPLFTIKIRLFKPLKKGERHNPDVLAITGAKVKRWSKGQRKSKPN